MPQFYAQPYDISATGFYFQSFDEYRQRAAKLRNALGRKPEEFEIQFIDGDQIDCALARAWEVNQVNLEAFFERALEWEDEAKLAFIIAAGECGCSFNPDTVDPSDFDVSIYYCGSMKELAEQFVDEGLFGESPDWPYCYINFEAIARDLAVEYAEREIAGQRLIFHRK